MYVIRKITRYNDGKNITNYFKEVSLGIISFSGLDNARRFHTPDEAQDIIKLITTGRKDFIEIVPV